MPRRKRVERPVPGPDAFRKTTEAAIQSQAAVLLTLGRQLRGDDTALVARARAAGMETAVEPMPAEDLAEFPVPTLHPSGKRVGLRRVSTDLTVRFGSALTKARIGEGETKSLRRLLPDLAERLYEEPTVETAAQLFEASLRHSDELVRVSAASSYFEISTQAKRLIKILAGGTRSEDNLVRNVAATALARVAPEHLRLRALTRSSPTKTAKKPANTSLLVHGTFARTSSWWQPGGDFHNYVLGNVRADLYGAADRFEWSGGYSDAARALGATELREWVDAHGLSGLDTFGHSHGANLAMLATQNGLTAGTLVLMSCPVHVPKYIADFTRVTRVVSVRVHLDLVILADRGGQRFNHPNIEEHVLPVWFDHSATHDPAIWRRHGVKTLLGL
jgi:hypothetical protein